MTTTLLMVNTAIVQQIVKDKPTPSRAEWAPLGQAYGRDYSTSDITKVVVLGSGTPPPTLVTAESPSQLSSTISLTLSTVAQAFGEPRKRALQLTGGKIASLEPPKLTRLFLTHLHFDHTEGMAEFMLAPWTLERKVPPQVYGPPGTQDMVDNLMKAYAKDIYIQMFGLERTNAMGWKWLAKKVLPGEVYKDNNVKITAYQNNHGSWDYSVRLSRRHLQTGWNRGPDDCL